MAALIGVSVSYLNTVGKFSYAGLSVLIFNITLCGFLIVPDFAKWGVFGFGVAMIVANLLRLAFQLGAMKEVILTPLRYIEPVSLKFIRVFLYGIASYALVVGAAVVFRTIHASGGDGELSAFNYANKLFELPAALLVAPVATVFLPLLADNTQMGANEFEGKFLAACGAAWALSFSSGVLGHQFMELLVGLIYGYGSMSVAGLESIASVAKIMVLALPAYALFQICSVALNAKMQTLRVFISTVFALMVGLGAAYFLSVFSVENPAAYGFVSFLWSAAIMTLFCLQLRSQALANLARKLGGALVMISLVVLIPVALIDAFDDSSKLLSGLGFLVAACLCGLVSLRHIRPLRSIQISTT
jgi:putative peptidoglycan lipid II flippase